MDRFSNKFAIIGPKIFLSESPIWVKSKNSFIWLDVYKKKIYIYDIFKKKTSYVKLKKKVCFIKHFYNNYFYLGLENEICIFNLISKKKKTLIVLKNLKKSQRVNDGNIDSRHNIYFGVYDEVKKNRGNLYKYIIKKKKLLLVDSDYITPNGPVFFSKIGKKYMFHNDTGKRIIYIYKIFKNKITRKVFLKFKKKNEKPDGIFIKDKNLYVGIFGNNYILKINVYSKKIKKIFFPAKNLNSCTIGGKKNNLLFVTSSLKKLKIKDIKKYPLSGYSIITKI